MIRLILLALLGGFLAGFFLGLSYRPNSVQCSVEVPSVTKGVTVFRLTECKLEDKSVTVGRIGF